MTVATYKVWICIEPLDAEGDNVGEDLDLPFGALAEFDGTPKGEAQAIAFAAKVQATHEQPTNIELRCNCGVDHRGESYPGGGC